MSSRQEIRRSEELLLELVYEIVSRGLPSSHEHDEHCRDLSVEEQAVIHARIVGYEEGWGECLDHLWGIIKDRESIWAMKGNA